MRTKKLQKVAKSAKKLVKKIRKIQYSDEYKAVWYSAYAHNMAYTGKNYGDELNDLEEKLHDLLHNSKKQHDNTD